MISAAPASARASPTEVSGDAAALWPVRILLALCILVPAIVFALFAVSRWQAAHQEATARVTRTLAVAHEHALKVLDNNETLLGRVLELVGTDDDEAIRAQESAIHHQLAVMAGDRQQIQSIWVWGPDGKPLAGNRFMPLPAGLDISDREFFSHHRQKKGGLYFTEPLIGKATKDAFFDMSIGRYRSDGSFAGLVSVGLYPAYFQRFHADLIRNEPGAVLTLFRADGVVYSRAPQHAAIASRVKGGLIDRAKVADAADPFVSTSPVDGARRIIAYRKVGKYPLYVAAGVDLAAVRSGWLKELAALGALGAVPVAGLLLAAIVALRRTRQAFDTAQRLQRETQARQRAEQALFQSKKLEAVGRLAGGVAHEFNNALMVVGGNLFILKRLLANQHGRYVEAMERGVESASQLTKQLLALSRQTAAAPEILRLQDRLPALQARLAPVLGPNIALSVSVDANVRPVQADPAELELTLVNVALNARDAIGLAGQLRLRAFNRSLPSHPTRRGEWVVIEAQDDGTGIEPKVLEHVFDPFFTTKQVGQGSGLGLSQVYAFCQRSGGWAEAESAPGHGTTIRLFLAPADQQQEPGGAPGTAPDAETAARVLLVDDNPEIAAVLEETLNAVGCSVVCQESADDAIEWLQANAAPDLVLTDVVMPGRHDGVDLTRHVQERYPGLPVILMTGYSQEMDELAALGVPVLSKPFSPKALLAAMAALHVRVPAG